MKEIYYLLNTEPYCYLIHKQLQKKIMYILPFHRQPQNLNYTQILLENLDPLSSTIFRKHQLP